MGGSALAALISVSWPGYTVPFEVCRTYDIPHYVGPNTLFVAASYSGNTEETISAIAQAGERGAKIAVIAGGGKLQQIAEEKSYPFVLLPKAEQPRYAVLYNLRAIITLMEHSKVLATDNANTELAGAAPYLRDAVKSWLPTIPASKNPAKALAQELMGQSPVIYAGPLLKPVAYKWKIGCNENAKNVAWWGEYPEFNHNEFIGWSSHPTHKPYGVIDLRSRLEHERVQLRFSVSERLLSGKRPAPHIVETEGDTVLKNILWTLAYGDFVTIYLGLLNGVDPAPVELVEKFKKELA
jgi:glucose/mannose-6-phosphate isomerase